jgi:hypothetical protein
MQLRPRLDRDERLEVSIRPLEDKYDREGPVVVEFRVVNTGSRPVRFKRYGTPFENGFSSGYFDVRRKSEALDFSPGIVARTRALSLGTLQLDPGEEACVRVNLAEAYPFERGGRYTVQYRGGPLTRLPDSPKIRIKLD